MTGRCAYPGECSNYLDGCGASCETADEYPVLPRNQIGQAWRAKRDLFTAPNAPLLLANSEWTRRTAEKSRAAKPGGVVRTIKLACPLDRFKPRDRAACREALGLPEDDFIVLFAACNVQERRKGLSQLLEALEILRLPAMTPVCFGRVEQVAGLYPGTIAMGYVDDPAKIAMLFAAADVFVGPSLLEAFGQVFVEAAASGTPSIGYRAGGVPEALVDGVTGRLVDTLEPAALAGAIKELHDDPVLRQFMGAWGRIHVENEWSPASAYHRLSCVLREEAERYGFEPPRSIKFPYHGADGRASACVEAEARADCRVVLGKGFGPAEGPFPRMGIEDSYHWATGRVSTIGFDVRSPGRFRVVIRCANLIKRQRIRVMHDGSIVRDIKPRRSRGYDDVLLLDVEADMNPGLHEWALMFDKTAQEENGPRELSLLVYGFDVERVEVGLRQVDRR